MDAGARTTDRTPARRRLRILAVGTAVVALLGAVAAPAAAARGNRPPDRPTEVGVAYPVATCSSTPVPVRSLTPTLTATPTDPDGDAVDAVFSLEDADGRRVWGPVSTGLQVSGVPHSVQVPEGVLRDGGAYRWRVVAQDARGRTSPPVKCAMRIDVTAPAMPEVSAVVGSAPAVYLEDEVAGGVGVAGELLLDGGSDDVVRFLYELNGVPSEVAATNGTATITVVPTTSGPQSLTVSAVDAAGNVSPQRLYRFTVTWTPRNPPAPVGDRWRLDEGAGTTASDRAGRNLITVQGTTSSWGDGPLAELGFDLADRALVFDGTDDVATSALPPVSTSSTFAVLATVRLDETGSAATAVSQDGAVVGRYELGFRTGEDCPSGTASCWAFVVAEGDAAGAGTVAAVSSVPVRAGSWFLLAGVHDVAAGTARLDVCEIGTADQPGDAWPVDGPPVAAPGAWDAAGPLRLGGALHDGATVRTWPGAIGSVSVEGGRYDSATTLWRCLDGVA